jgi:PAS domain S-box-containing protein
VNRVTVAPTSTMREENHDGPRPGWQSVRQGRGARLTAEEEFIARKRAEAALRASEERSRLALDAAAMGTWDWDVVHDVHSWSPETEALFGMAPGTFEGTFEAFRRAVHPDDWPVFEVEIEASQHEQRDSIATYRVIWPDGSMHWLENRGRAVFAVAGTLLRVTGTCMDITERKLAEENLKHSEARLAEAQEIAHVGSWELDLGNQQLSWSAEHYRIFGLDPQRDNLPYVEGLSYIHPDDRAAVQAQFDSAIDRRGSYSMDLRRLRPDGSVAWIHSRGAFVAGADGGAGRMVGTAQDITGRVEGDRQQTQLAAHIKSLLESTSEGIYGLALDGRCTFINPAGAALLGYAPDELVGLPMHAQVHHHHANGTPFPIETCRVHHLMR